MMDRKKRFLAFFTALNLLPATAFGSSDPVSYRELDLAEAKALIPHFSIKELEPGVVRLSGYVPRKCATQLQIENTYSDESIRSGNTVGFKIIRKRSAEDDENCFKENKATRFDRETQITLAELGGANSTLRFSEVGDRGEDLNVGLLSNAEGDPKFALLDPPVVFVSEKTLENARAAAHRSALRDWEKKRDDYLDGLEDVARCKPRNQDDVEVVRTAVRQLCALGVYDSEECEKEERKLSVKSLKLLEKEALSEDATLEDLEALLAEVEAHAGQGFDDQVLASLERIRKRIVNDPEATMEHFELAEEAVEQAKDLDVSAAWRKRLMNEQLQLALGKGQMKMQSGWNWDTYGYWSKLMHRMQNNAWSSCRAKSANMESCTSAMNAVQVAAQLPQVGMQVNQAQQQWQANFQQQFMQALMPTGMDASGRGAFGGAFTTNANTQNPLGNLGAPGTLPGHIPLSGSVAIAPQIGISPLGN